MFLCWVHSMQNQCNPEFRFVWQLRRTDGTCGSPLERPEEGVACKPYPTQQMVGGESAVLFDSSYPTGVHAA